MSDFVFSSSTRSSIRSELRAFVRLTGAVHVEFVDFTSDETPVVASAGAFGRMPSGDDDADLHTCAVFVRNELSLIAWLPESRCIETAQRELNAMAEELKVVALHALIEKRAWIAIAQSWRCDDIGRRDMPSLVA